MRYVMTVSEACELVIKAGEQGKNGDVYILDMGEPVSIMDLKKKYFGSYPHRTIGVRPGEQMIEKLMTTDEEAICTKVGNYFIIKQI